MKILILCCTLYLFSGLHLNIEAASKSAKKKSEKIISIKEFKNCESNKVTGLLKNITKNNLGKGRVSISADLDINQDVGEVDKIIGDVEKCKSALKEGCEFFMRVPLGKPCEVINLKDQIWSPVFLNLKPPLTCPIKKGRHELRNAEFKMEHLKAFSNLTPFFEKFYWIIKVKIYKEKILLCCVEVFAKIEIVRV